MRTEVPSMCNTIRLPTTQVDQCNMCGSSNRGYLLNGVPKVAMVTDITAMALSFLELKKGEEAVGMAISLTDLAGVAMVTGIKD